MQCVLGVDEVGRGPLAGPVAVGIVAVLADFDVAAAFPGVADSKKLSEKKREKLFELLLEREAAGEVRFRVELESAHAIDREGIAVVIRRAVARGVHALVPDAATARVLLDGSLTAPADYAQETIIGGDATVPIISLASIAAKVTRDRLMLDFAREYPQYGFEAHKGYGTKAHYEALQAHGICAVHRTSFIHL